MLSSSIKAIHLVGSVLEMKTFVFFSCSCVSCL